jgi:NAD(P)H-dependent flavin oxidoreductase YrpB (nitropropane dioxygenase family)
MWPNNRILELFGIQLPIIQAPMAGSVLSEMVVAVSEAGGLGSLPCALLSLEQMRNELEAIRRQSGFCPWSSGGADRNGLFPVPEDQDQPGVP